MISVLSFLLGGAEGCSVIPHGGILRSARKKTAAAKTVPYRAVHVKVYFGFFVNMLEKMRCLLYNDFKQSMKSLNSE